MYNVQAYEEAKRRLQMETEDRKRIIPEIKKKSRRAYLIKRHQDKMEDLEQELEEEEYYFGEQRWACNKPMLLGGLVQPKFHLCQLPYWQNKHLLLDDTMGFICYYKCLSYLWQKRVETCTL